MKPHASISACLLLCLTQAGTWADGGQAIESGGLRRDVIESDLVHASSDSWPGWLALRMDPAIPPDREIVSAMCLQDGQLVVGGFEPVGKDLWWRNPHLGAFRMDLDRVSWIGPASLLREGPPMRDQVRFVNGDQAEGFIQSIDVEHGVRVETTGGGDAATRGTVDHDLSRIASIRMSERAEKPTGWRIWLRDGSRIDADAWTRQGERIVLRGCHLPAAPPSITLGWNQVGAIRRDSTSPLPLASLAWSASDVPDSPRLSPARVHVVPEIVPLGLQAIDLHGPGTFQATVPAGGVVDGALSAPPSLGGQIGCTVVVLDGDREMLRTRASGPAWNARVHGPVETGRLVVRIKGSDRGAFGAAVRWCEAIVVPGTTGSPAASSPPATGTGGPLVAPASR